MLIRSLLACSALLASGCATVSGTPTQAIVIQAVDAKDQPVPGMRCRASNGATEYFGDAPMLDLRVRRSSADLVVECRRGNLVARGTAVSRGDTVLTGVMPGGMAALVIDHVTGYRYTYPTTMRLRVGQHLVFDTASEPPARMLAEIAAE
jgi:hypothetical protein